jgi:hypothetical protein
MSISRQSKSAGLFGLSSKTSRLILVAENPGAGDLDGVRGGLPGLGAPHQLAPLCTVIAGNEPYTPATHSHGAGSPLTFSDAVVRWSSMRIGNRDENSSFRHGRRAVNRSWIFVGMDKRKRS